MLFIIYVEEKEKKLFNLNFEIIDVDLFSYFKVTASHLFATQTIKLCTEVNKQILYITSIAREVVAHSS